MAPTKRLFENGLSGKAESSWISSWLKSSEEKLRLFSIALFIYIVSTCLGSSSLGNDCALVDHLVSLLKWCSLLCLYGRILFLIYAGEITLKQDCGYLVTAAVALSTCAISFVTSGEKALALSMAFCIACYRVPWGVLLKKSYYYLLISILLVFALNLLGLSESALIFRVDGETGLRSLRESYGFSHPNTAATYLILLYFLRLMIVKGEFRLFDYFATCFLFVVLFFSIGSRTSSLILLASIALVALKRLHPGKYKKILLALIIMYFFCGVIIVPLYVLNMPGLLSIDALLSGRLAYAAKIAIDYPITLFGQQLPLIGTIEASLAGVDPLVLDNAYYHLLMAFGVVSFGVVVAVYGAVVRKAYRAGSVEILMVVALLALMGITEVAPYTFVGGFMMAYAFANEDIKTARQVGGH